MKCVPAKQRARKRREYALVQRDGAERCGPGQTLGVIDRGTGRQWHGPVRRATVPLNTKDDK
jgi:hypothetical protein